MKNLYLILIIAFLSACTTDVALDIPEAADMIVVEGKIEQGGLPRIVLTKSIPYYAQIDSSTLINMFVTDADYVRVTDDMGNSVDCFFKLDLQNFAAYYEPNDSTILGQVGHHYGLEIKVDTQLATAQTYIPEQITLDSLWFEAEVGDSLGFLYGHLTDPDTIGNNYRFFAKRLNKDGKFIAPWGAPFDDKFINGQSFDFFYYRGIDANSLDPEDQDENAYYYRKGDTVVVKFTTLDSEHYQFWKTAEGAEASSGNPFAAPITPRSNIEGGYGIWGGYGVSYDTLICVENE